MGPTLTRRGLLAVGGATGMGLVLAGCTGDARPVTPSTSAAPPPPDPLLALLTDGEAVVERYDATGVAHPGLVGRLSPLRAQAAEQVVALRLALALPAATSAATSSAPASGTSATSPPPGLPVSPDPAVALAELRSAVAAAGSAAETLCLVTSAQRAPLVGSLAAAAAGHDLLLA